MRLNDMKALRVTFVSTLAPMAMAMSALAGEENPGSPDKCTSVVSEQLKVLGVNMASLKNPQWLTDNFNHRGVNTVSGYRFYGEPPTCTNGEIAVEMNALCGISDVYTTGECRIKGAPHYWF
ncbi:hypothetical protein [Accumulibacter sp.]|uniref:hypothetical protein n=1 Tax=Accumulibacter sp. TaxID=2053492 RepID=UPI0025D1FA35|nr:hypothetical protein [Accumulibacter sp.]MCM8626613.1 hypothetical protein [Accumulibacter sp.]